MTICLIRHGKTEANEKRLYCGSTDLPLSDEGAEELRGLHYEIPHARFLTSGMKRTEQTLEILFGAVEHTADEGFREVDFGAFEMRSYGQLKQNSAYLAWISGDNEANTPPGGESGVQMRQRVRASFRAVLQSRQDTVIVTHGGVIASIMADLFPQEQKTRYQWQPEPGHGYAISGGRYRTIPEQNGLSCDPA